MKELAIISSELENLIKHSESKECIGAWAYEKYIHCENKQLSDFLLQLSSMEMGEEFYLTNEELMSFVNELSLSSIPKL